MTDHDRYVQYLFTRRPRALAYRNWYLYPRLCGYLHGKVLDIGCGIGDLLRYRPNTVGVDVNPHAVAWCRQQGLPAEIMEPDHLPFQDGTFDGAMLDNVLEHLESPRPLLAEVRRVLTPTGVVVAGVPGRRGYIRDADHKVYYDKDALIALMKAAGFAPRRVFRMPLPGPLLDRWVRQQCVYGVFRRV